MYYGSIQNHKHNKFKNQFDILYIYFSLYIVNMVGVNIFSFHFIYSFNLILKQGNQFMQPKITADCKSEMVEQLSDKWLYIGS